MPVGQEIKTERNELTMADISIPELARSLVVPGIVFFIVSIVSFETIWFIAVDAFSLTRDRVRHHW